ncbi:MAG: hypothetical protein ND866_11760 [Pyrinomonadaceae bacterium]|nr:hypothetical protein [Pyrinomonadaceae bacterium]
MFQQQRHVQPAIANELGAGPSSIDESTVPEALQDVVLRHQVSYEVWQEWSRCGGRARQIGYCVSICGVNDRVDCVRGHHVPGCPHCGLTYDEIRKIAEWITLKEQPDCRFQIEPFDRAWHIAPTQRGLRNEIIVNIQILRSHNVDGPVSESQERCLNEVRVELNKLGVREGAWQTAR